MERKHTLDAPCPTHGSQASWLRQLKVALWKNSLLMMRRPVTLLFMLLSTVASVSLCAALVRGDPYGIKVDFADVPLSPCGTVDPIFFEENEAIYTEQVPLSYNEAWRSGFGVELLALGPMFHGIMAFVLLQVEIQTEMLGILRSLGMSESVFWVSWWIPFLCTALLNSLGGAIAAVSFSNIHAFANIYFGGILASFFFLNIALVGAAMFMSAVCGTTRGGAATWCIVVMLIAQWGPFLTQVFSVGWPIRSVSDMEYEYATDPPGLFWLNRETADIDYFGNRWNRPFIDDFFTNSTQFAPEPKEEEACHRPIVTREAGGELLSEQQREAYPEDQWHIGCYIRPGYSTDTWNDDKKIGVAILFFFPYFHFTATWSNFVGYTAMKNRSFGHKQSTMDAASLAVASLPDSFVPEETLGSTLIPQGSFLKFVYVTLRGIGSSNCPAASQNSLFCDQLFSCDIVSTTKPLKSFSVSSLHVFQIVLALMYSLLACYVAQVFPHKNGAPRPFWFFLLPGYWTGTRIDQDADPSTGVTANDIRKSYGSIEALRGVSLSFKRGEVTALLGHNGAGKTTLSHILSGTIGGFAGDVKMFGAPVTHNPDLVRDLVAVCKQDDYLYPDLTARQHLLVFGGIRGVPEVEIEQTTQEWLESVDLALVQDQHSSGFSGGMKRRLSLALSTIGHRPLVILDEPTTGMDPISRRFVWKHIDCIKNSRVVILTTHAMEEADLLADTVVIVRKGQVAAFGSPLNLKSEHGSALCFSILVDTEHVDTTANSISLRFKKFGDAVDVVSEEAGNLTVKIRKVVNHEVDDAVTVKALTDFVAWLEDDVSNVREYGFSNSSLEEVFLAVTLAEEEVHAQTTGDIADEYDVCCSSCSKNCIRCCLRGVCSCCCCPRRRREIEDTFDAQGIETREDNISTEPPQQTVLRQTVAMMYFSFSRNWIGKVAPWIFVAVLLLIAFWVSFRATNAFVRVPVMCCLVVPLSLPLVTLVSPTYSDRRSGLFMLMKTQGVMQVAYILAQSLYAFAYQLMFGLLVAICIYIPNLYRQPSLCQDGGTAGFGDDFYRRDDCYPNLYEWQRIESATQIWTDPDSGASILATWKGGSLWKLFCVVFVFALSRPGILFMSSYLPGHKLANVTVATLVICSAVIPIIPYFRVKAEEQLECTERISNPERRFDSLDDIRNNSAAFLNYVGIRVADVQSLCLPTTGAILPAFGVFQLLSLTLFSNVLLVSDPPEYIHESLVPNLQNVICSGDTCEFPFARKRFWLIVGVMILCSVIFMFLGCFMVSFFSFPSGYILRLREAVRRITTRNDGRARKDTEVKDGEEMEEVTAESAVAKAMMIDCFDKHAGVFADERLQLTMSDEIPRILCNDLRKVYPSRGSYPPKVALESLDLHVRKGEVLGLLGKNGAGKTTAIKILAINHEATSGVALVSGFNVAEEPRRVFESLGNCPQFDVVAPTESVMRHIEFFALLKGIPFGSFRKTAKAIATSVGLGSASVLRRRASQLSGGMRRRLSIAISLVGAPRVLLLDEPTTGLDPSTRSTIWQLINSLSTQDRAIVITTHMMLEADTLCSRIAIMSQGKLKVIGTQQTLKDRYGSGYQLQVNLTNSSAEHREKALDFVKRRIHPDAELQNQQAKTLRITLPRDINLSKIFSVLYSPEMGSEGCINQFLLSQSSLEDVFLNLGDA